jgi:Flp pilus assembly pilin Flp
LTATLDVIDDASKKHRRLAGLRERNLGEHAMAYFLKQLAAREDGATWIEYTMLIFLIGVALMGLVTTLGIWVGTQLTTAASLIGG